MATSINFVRERQRDLSKQEVVDRLWFRYSVIGFGVVSALSLLVLGSRFFLSFQVNQVMARQAQLTRSLTSQEDVEKSYILFFQKLAVLKELLNQKSNKQAAIQFFGTIFGPTVLIQEINYQAEDALLSFGLQAENVFELDQVFETLNSGQVKAQFLSVSKSALRRQADGTYTMMVTVQLREVAEETVAPRRDTADELIDTGDE